MSLRADASMLPAFVRPGVSYIKAAMISLALEKARVTMAKNKVVIRTKLFLVRYVHCCKASCRHCPHGPYIYSPHGEYFGHPDFETFSHAVKFALTKRRHRGKKVDKARLQRVCSVAEKVAQTIAAGAAAGVASHGIDLL